MTFWIIPEFDKTRVGSLPVLDPSGKNDVAPTDRNKHLPSRAIWRPPTHMMQCTWTWSVGCSEVL